jgi:hypothetical protein
LVRYTDDPDRGWGLFGRASIADGNPNPIRYFLSTGLGGFSPLRHQRGDTFGVGWFLVGASDQFGPVPTALFGPQNGIGVEWFYNVQATPWLNITPDLQWIRPGLGAISTDNAFVYGIRANATFGRRTAPHVACHDAAHGGARYVAQKIDDDSGVGTQVTVADLNGDKKSDVVVANKRGVFAFTQQ